MSAPALPDDALENGSVLDGRYRIDGVIGGGGMARVYRAEHLKISRPVAIKVLHVGMSQNRDAVARFQREATTSGRLVHPNIVTVSDFGMLPDGRSFLVMEALEGETLADRLAREDRLPWRAAVTLLRELLLGLRHAHEHGVIHRDIKPENIFLLRGEGQPPVKILDFGIAKLYASMSDSRITQTGLTIGTPIYMSPEQAVDGEITPASDLYSATVVLFEMLTGDPPFRRDDPIATMKAHLHAPPPRLRAVAPEVDFPDELEEIVARGLAKMAIDRIPSAERYLSMLDGMKVSEILHLRALRLATDPHIAAPAARTPQTVAAVADPTALVVAAAQPARDTGTPIPAAPAPDRVRDTDTMMEATSLLLARSRPRRRFALGALLLAGAASVVTFQAVRSLRGEDTGAKPGRSAAAPGAPAAAPGAPPGAPAVPPAAAAALAAALDPAPPAIDTQQRHGHPPQVATDEQGAAAPPSPVAEAVPPAASPSSAPRRSRDRPSPVAEAAPPAAAIAPPPPAPRPLPPPAAAPERARDREQLRRWLTDGAAALAAGRFDAAAAAFQRAIAADAAAPAAHAGLAEVAFNKGDFPRAVLTARRAVAFAPGVAAHRMILAKAYYKLLRYDDAIAQWQKVLELEPAGPSRERARKNIEMAREKRGP